MIYSTDHFQKFLNCHRTEEVNKNTKLFEKGYLALKPSLVIVSSMEVKEI